MSQRLRCVAAILLVVTAGLFVIGVAVEDDTHTEAIEGTSSTESAENREASHHEGAEAAGSSEGDHDDSAEEAASHDE